MFLARFSYFSSRYVYNVSKHVLLYLARKLALWPDILVYSAIQSLCTTRLPIADEAFSEVSISSGKLTVSRAGEYHVTLAPAPENIPLHILDLPSNMSRDKFIEALRGALQPGVDPQPTHVSVLDGPDGRFARLLFPTSSSAEKVVAKLQLRLRFAKDQPFRGRLEWGTQVSKVS